jgi:vanillin dehydrogenase
MSAHEDFWDADCLSEGAAYSATRDPMTGKVATTTAASTVEDVNRAAEAAAKGFETWSETGPGARRALLLKAADLMESRTNDFIKLMLEETGASAAIAGDFAPVRLSGGRSVTQRRIASP